MVLAETEVLTGSLVAYQFSGYEYIGHSREIGKPTFRTVARKNIRDNGS